MGSEVSNAGSAVNPYNYPFGLWLYGSEVIKMTGLSPIDGIFVFTLIFLFVLIGCFYFYSGFILATKEQKLIATLFFISMPNMALLMLSYRPSVFILPFLFLILYFAYKDAVDWKMTALMMLVHFHHRYQPYRHVHIPADIFHPLFSPVLPHLGKIFRAVLYHHPRDICHLRNFAELVSPDRKPVRG